MNTSKKIYPIYDVNINDNDMANMKRTKFYFCGKCGNIIASTNNVILNCCGQKLTELKAKELKNNKNGEKSVDKDGNLTRNDIKVDNKHGLVSIKI